MTSNAKEFDPGELKEHNGKGRPTVYVAVEGKVYDVSGSKLWKTGSHMKRHPGGEDLTEELTAAPHGPQVLERVPQVGTLKPETDPMDEGVPAFLLKLFESVPMLRRHPHPMAVHFPIAFCMVIPFFNILFLGTGRAGFEETAFYLLFLGVVAAAAAAATGPYTWWLNYGAKMTFNIRVKIAASSILLSLLVVGLVWRLLVPDVLLASGPSSLIYLLLTLTYPVLVIVLGWFGAKMTFPA